MPEPPADWCRGQVRDLVEPSRRVTYGIVQPGPRQRKEVGVPIIRGQDYSSGLVATEGLYYVLPQIAASYSRSTVKEGDLLLSIVGYVGLVAEVPAALDGANLTQTTARVAIGHPFFARYFLHYFKSAAFRAEVRRFTKGSAQPGLNLADVELMRVTYPRRPEQRQIAEILDTVDEAIRKTEEIIAKLKQMKQGLLHDLLTRGIDDNGELRDPARHPEQFKESPLGRIPKAWALTALGEVAEVDRGKFTHRPRNDPDYYGGRFPFIQTGDITGTEGRLLVTYSQSLNERGANVSREFPEQTIAITIAANIADTAILGVPMYFPDSVVGAIVSPPNNVRFIQLCIQRAKRRLDARAPQSAQKNINLQDLRPLLIPHPTPEEQQRIAAGYEAHLIRTQSEDETLRKLRFLRKGLMEDLLTGHVRVTPLLKESAE